MSKIKKLSQHEIQRVAAGEVVEKPANIVKELIENALDAEATSIIVRIERGGKKSIRVTDNGFGMSAEDAAMSVVHHATSKITSIDDLFRLKTFGFRGEALSSISSVSHMTLVTKEASATEATKLVLAGGDLVEKIEVAHTTGTDITIEDLFYNMPARRKFLKTDETEWRAIYQLMQAYALTKLSCAFALYADEKLIFQCRPCQKSVERLHLFYEPHVLKAFMPFSASESQADFSFDGLMTDQQYGRYDRSHIFFFVNGRWVKNSKLTHAFLKGYAHVLPPARYPAGIITLTVDPELVDINIHPRKEEVGFLHPKRIENAITKAVSEKLSAYVSQTVTGYNFTRPAVQDPSLDMRFDMHKRYDAVYGSVREESAPQPNLISSGACENCFDQARDTREDLRENHPAHDAQSGQAISESCNVGRCKESCPVFEQTLISPEQEERAYALIGQIKNTYLVVETDEGIIFVDQHAAHERILYDLFGQKFTQAESIPLIFPPIFIFSEQEAALFSEHRALFEAYGIVIEQCDSVQYAIKKIPIMLKNCDVATLVKETLATVGEFDGVDDDLFNSRFHHNLRASMACKAAVKAGDQLSTEQMHELIRSLNKTKDRFACPHGRPTSWMTTWYELEKKFKRKI